MRPHEPPSQTSEKTGIISPAGESGFVDYQLLTDEASQAPSIVDNTSAHSHSIQIADDADKVRLSKGLTIERLVRLRLAAAYADRVGYPLHHHLVIRFLGGDWFPAAPEHEYIQRKVSEWLTNNVGFAYFVWVKESNDRPHSHFLIHIPNPILARRLGKRIRLWLKKYHRMKKRDGLPMGTVRLRGLPKGWYFDTDQAHRNQVNYITKRGGDNSPCAKIDDGEVVDNPSGTSQNLGPSARANGLVPSYRKSLSTNNKTQKSCEIFNQPGMLKPAPHLGPKGNCTPAGNSVSPPADRSFAEDIHLGEFCQRHE